jgi:hypothetical protein
MMPKGASSVELTEVSGTCALGCNTHTLRHKRYTHKRTHTHIQLCKCAITIRYRNFYIFYMRSLAVARFIDGLTCKPVNL